MHTVWHQTSRQPALLALLLILLLAACTPRGGEPGVVDPGDGAGGANDPGEAPEDAGEPVTLAELEGTRWHMTAYGPAASPGSPVAGFAPTAGFDNLGEMHGTTGCNNYFAAISLDGTALTVDRVQQTEMACQEAGVMEQESAFLAALGSARRLGRDGQELVIGYDGGLLRFAPEPAPQASSLTDTAWQLREMTLDGQQVKPAGEQTPTIAFQVGQVRGSAGCNQYGGMVTVDGETIQFGDLAQTEMYCMDDGVMEQETAFMQLLQSARAFSLAENTLTIRGDRGQMVLVPLEPPADARLEGQSWTLTAFGEGDVVTSLLAGTTITASFEAGQITGSAGCNDYFGPYEVDGQTLRFGPLGATRRACQEGVDQQEFRFLQALETVHSWHIEGQQLTLVHEQGALHFMASAELN